MFYETIVNISKSINLHQGLIERKCFTLGGDLRSSNSCPYSKEGNQTSDVVSDSLRTQQPESDQSLHLPNSNRLQSDNANPVVICGLLPLFLEDSNCFTFCKIYILSLSDLTKNKMIFTRDVMINGEFRNAYHSC